MAENMTNQLGHAYDWNDTIENDSTFQLLPKGTYPFTVRSFERGEHSGSEKLPACKKAILTIDIDGGALGTATVKHNLFLHSRCEGLLCAFFTSIGQRQHGQQIAMNWQLVPGSRGLCEVGVRKWTNNNGQERESNEITRFLEPAPAPSHETPAAASWSSGKF